MLRTRLAATADSLVQRRLSVLARDHQRANLDIRVHATSLSSVLAVKLEHAALSRRVQATAGEAIHAPAFIELDVRDLQLVVWNGDPGRGL